jgi:hypothetical protein
MFKYTSKDNYILDEDEQKIIVDWVKKNYKTFKPTGYHRGMNSLQNYSDVPECIWNIKQRIVEKEGLENEKQDPFFKDAVGYMWEGGSLHKHTDPNIENLIHVRYNVYVQIPYEGGIPVYNNIRCNLKERTYICCRSGIDYHWCEKVIGERERIVLSFGFMLPKERIENIIYEYE